MTNRFRTRREPDFGSGQEKAAPWSQSPQEDFDVFSREIRRAPKGYGKIVHLGVANPRKGEALPSILLLKLNDFCSYRVPNPICQRVLRQGKCIAGMIAMPEVHPKFTKVAGVPGLIG